MSDTTLVLERIDKRFGAVSALAGASLAVRRGTVHAVLGENGAGKSTLMRIAFGMMRPNQGHIIVDGTPRQFHSSADALACGIGMVHQHFTLVPAMTAADNIALGGHGRLRRDEVAARVAELAADTGLVVDPLTRVASLSVGAQQRVEILKALYRNARLLILDEPTAVLTPQEADELFAWLRRFVARGGTAVLVTHKLAEALSIADDVTVLRRGAVSLHAPAAQVDTATLVRAMTGMDGDPSHEVQRPSGAAGAVVAQLTDVVVRDGRGVTRLRGATLSCHGGQVIGVAGVEGSGVQELVRVLAGRLAPSGGRAALPTTIGYVPEDRLRDALIEEFTLTENVALHGAATRRGLMPWATLAAQTARVIARHEVQTTGVEARGGALSGGNQQKLVMGRELDSQPALVVAENPVRGLDIRATAQVLRELTAAADRGSAVIVYSADLDEVLPLANRMVVVFDGVVREVPVDRHAVASALVGAA